MTRREFPSQSRLILGITILLFGGTTLQIAAELSRRDYLFESIRWTALFLASLAALAVPVALLIASWTEWWERLESWFDRGLGLLKQLGRFNLFFFLLIIAAYSFLILGPTGRYLKEFIPRLSLFWMTCLVGSVFLKAFAPQRSWIVVLSATWLLAGVGYRLLAFIPDVSTYPFTLSWSEASRYYYASLFLSERIYGEAVPLSPLHPSRYLMQAIPFTIPQLPLWFHRAWQVLLWLATAFGLAYLLNHRLSRNLPAAEEPRTKVGMEDRELVGILFVGMAFLFLFQGPVYYHLLLIPILLVWGFDRTRPWKAMALVIVASTWAGISRVNWYPVPGMLAAVLYFLEVDFEPAIGSNRFRSAVNYLSWPAIWILVGTLAASLTQAVYILWSGVEGEAFTSSFSSDLLWYRLFPNPTFPLGILPAAVLVSAPMLTLLARELRGLHLNRLAGLAGILVVLFTGGVVVSAKIGGGSNLHNLDAYLVLLLIMGGYALFQSIQRGKPGKFTGRLPSLSVLAAMSVIPVLMAISTGGYHPLPEKPVISSALNEIKGMVDQAVGRGGEVLFISERQLLTFNNLPLVGLVDPYEKVFLMEMAMAGNQVYLGSYYDDLAKRRFALIITDPLKDVIKGEEFSFGEENDAWVKRVVRPTLEAYRSKKLFKELSIEVLEPKP
ncbi:MAG TPA: hypothetical protein VI776_14315 [Anaerolineales bacterium]|nr:hypothetical protein [Anaerolineales bacterium]